MPAPGPVQRETARLERGHTFDMLGRLRTDGARVAAAAGAGEVLVSSTVKDLVTGSGIGFVDRGTQVLKGVPGEWRLFAASP